MPMTRRLLPALLSLAVLVGAPRTAPPPSEEPTPLRAAMEDLKAHLKVVALSLRAGADPTTPQGAAAAERALEHVAGMQAAALAAKAEAPPEAGELPEAERAAHRTAFRRDLALLLGELADLEVELLEGRRDDAAARIAGSLFQLREASHERYQRER